MIKWSEKDKALLAEKYSELGPVKLASIMEGRTSHQISAKASILGLCKSHKPEIERFNANFRVSEGCWNWVARLCQDGYGFFSSKSKDVRAHRYAYALKNGPIPPGMCVCHSCDNRACVNPSHLFLGTNEDNIADRTIKGRSARPLGLKNKNAKLTEDQVRAIRETSGQHQEVATIFGVSKSQVCKIKKRSAWPHIV